LGISKVHYKGRFLICQEFFGHLKNPTALKMHSKNRPIVCDCIFPQGRTYSAIASTGQPAAQAPQEMQASASIT
jgi:hypothetical protein